MYHTFLVPPSAHTNYLMLLPFSVCLWLTCTFTQSNLFYILLHCARTHTMHIKYSLDRCSVSFPLVGKTNTLIHSIADVGIKPFDSFVPLSMLA